MSGETITIDGGSGSGSGTIVRDAASYAALTGRGVRVHTIRAKRDKPGLRPQHLKGLQACADLCGGELRNAEAGAREFELIPRAPVRGGEYDWDIGTAGSATMVCLSLLPLGLFADGPSVYVLRGGLFQDYAPTALHMRYVLMAALARMGVEARLEIHRPGYVPSGGGRLELTILPAKTGLRPLDMLDAGRPDAVRGIALCSHLVQRRVSQRMRRACVERLEEGSLSAEIETIDDTGKAPAYREAARQPGACLAVWATTSTGCVVGSDMAGAPGRPAEEIGRRVADRLWEDVSAGASVDRFLADQLIPFAALAGGESAYRIPSVTAHVSTRLWLAGELLGASSGLRDRVLRIRGVG
jgi:RNA 3'-terminal phosphate cyclase (ATP)